MDSNKFLVPHDFTEVGDTALDYTLFLAKDLDSHLYLLHIIKNEKQKEEALETLQEIINKRDYENNITIFPIVEVGNIFEDINAVALKNEVHFVVMGTHGALGMQKFFGSYAMKVINKSTIPYIIVQSGLNNQQFELEHILMPITDDKETWQAAYIVANFANVFGCMVNIVAQKFTDAGQARQVMIGFSILEKTMKEKGVNIEAELIELKTTFQEAVVNYAFEKKIDLIAISQDNSLLLPQFDKNTQRLITNKRDIPCLVLNAKILSKRISF